MGHESELVTEWSNLAARYAAVNCALEKELQAAHQLSVPEFEALKFLATAKEDTKVAELVSVTHLSQSAISRLVARLESEGLVNRRMCTNDRRCVFAELTDKGRKRYQQAEPTQVEVLRHALGEGA